MLRKIRVHSMLIRGGTSPPWGQSIFHRSGSPPRRFSETLSDRQDDLSQIHLISQPAAHFSVLIQQQPTFPWWRTYEKLRLCWESACPGPVVDSFSRRMWWRECKPKAHTYTNANANTAGSRPHSNARCPWDIRVCEQHHQHHRLPNES